MDKKLKKKLGRVLDKLLLWFAGFFLLVSTLDIFLRPSWPTSVETVEIAALVAGLIMATNKKSVGLGTLVVYILGLRIIFAWAFSIVWFNLTPTPFEYVIVAVMMGYMLLLPTNQSKSEQPQQQGFAE